MRSTSIDLFQLTYALLASLAPVPACCLSAHAASGCVHTDLRCGPTGQRCFIAIWNANPFEDDVNCRSTVVITEDFGGSSGRRGYRLPEKTAKCRPSLDIRDRLIRCIRSLRRTLDPYHYVLCSRRFAVKSLYFERFCLWKFCWLFYTWHILE